MSPGPRSPPRRRSETNHRWPPRPPRSRALLSARLCPHRAAGPRASPSEPTTATRLRATIHRPRSGRAETPRCRLRVSIVSGRARPARPGKSRRRPARPSRRTGTCPRRAEVRRAVGRLLRAERRRRFRRASGGRHAHQRADRGRCKQNDAVRVPRGTLTGGDRRDGLRPRRRRDRVASVRFQRRSRSTGCRATRRDGSRPRYLPTTARLSSPATVPTGAAPRRQPRRTQSAGRRGTGQNPRGGSWPA